MEKKLTKVSGPGKSVPLLWIEVTWSVTLFVQLTNMDEADIKTQDCMSVLVDQVLPLATYNKRTNIHQRKSFAICFWLQNFYMEPSL